VTAFTNPATSNTQVTISCDNGYDVALLQVTDSAQPTAHSYQIPVSELTKNESTGIYTYELSTSTLTDPTRVEVTFARMGGDYYTVKTVSGVGGSLYTDKVSAAAGDTIRIYVPNDPTYVLSSLKICGGENLADQVWRLRHALARCVW